MGKITIKKLLQKIKSIIKKQKLKSEFLGDNDKILDEQQIKKLYDRILEKHKNCPIVGITLGQDCLEAEYRQLAEYKHFERIIKIQPKDKILDLGCGVGRWTIPFACRGKSVTAVDISQEALNIAEKNAKEKNLKNIKFKRISVADYIDNQQYEIIYIGGVLLYINDYRLRKLVKNVYKMLKKNGKLVLRESISLDNKSFSVKCFLKDYQEFYLAYYRTPKALVEFFLKKFKLNYQLDAYVDIFVVKFFRMILPKFLRNNSLIKFFILPILNIQVLCDPYLLKWRWLINKRNKNLINSGWPSTQYFFILEKNKN